ncbi:MAG TPA: hypothetical protein VIV60_04525 [Polyangiaceae bacterium]
MKNVTSLIAGLAVVGMAAGIGLLVQSWGDHKPSLARAPHQQSNRAQPLGEAAPTHDALISARVAALASEVSELKGQLAEAKQSNAEHVELEPPAEAISPQEAKREWHAHLAEVEAKFGAERLDNRWASETQSMIERGLTETPGLRSAMRKLECRSETCRLELVETGDVAGSMGPFIHQLGTSLPMSKSDLVEEGNGKSVHVIYLFRSNEST